jgi:hypothetical protein
MALPDTEINTLKRILINAIIAVMTFFMSAKMAQRTVFATVDDVRKEIGPVNLLCFKLS